MLARHGSDVSPPWLGCFPAIANTSPGHSSDAVPLHVVLLGTMRRAVRVLSRVVLLQH